jgi:hypothetical protein
MEEEGGINLYAFVNNSGVNGWDYLGLARTAGECCLQAKEQGLDQGDAGGVVCCDGDMVACSWTYLPDDNGGLGDFIEELHRECTTKHELDHFHAVPDCPKCGLHRMLKPKKGFKLEDEEAHAGCVSIKCYERKRSSCAKAPNPAECYRIVQATINNFKNSSLYGRDCYNK